MELVTVNLVSTHTERFWPPQTRVKPKKKKKKKVRIPSRDMHAITVLLLASHYCVVYHGLIPRTPYLIEFLRRP